MSYVKGDREPGCIFCNAVDHAEDVQSLVVYQGDSCLIMLNRFPYNTGHLMVVPFDHASSLEDLPATVRAEMMELTSLALEVCRLLYRCDGFNTGINIGQAAGAGIAGHLHLHVVPRWTGDANFMPVLGKTLTLPETLEVTHARLRAEFATTIARKQTDSELAAGALVYLPERAGFVLRKRDGQPVVLPKGKIDDGESSDQTAVREVLEETGVTMQIAGWLGSQVISPSPKTGSPQHVVFFLGVGREAPRVEQHLSSDSVVVPLDDLLDTFEIPELRAVVERALPAVRMLAGAG